MGDDTNEEKAQCSLSIHVKSTNLTCSKKFEVITPPQSSIYEPSNQPFLWKFQHFS